MGEFVKFLAGFWEQLFNKLTLYPFEINGISVSIPALLFAFLVVGLVVSVFWKGAKT